MTTLAEKASHPKVLVVSRADKLLTAIERQLETLAQVLSCGSPKDALALLHSETIDAVIAEDTAVETVGTELFATLVEEFPQPARVLISAGRHADPIIEAVNRGWIFHCLDSSWQSADLRAALDAALRSDAPGQSPARAPSPHGHEDPIARRPSVLFIDDEPINLTIARVAFEERYDVHAVASGEAARAVLASHPIDVVVADLHMPRTTGIDLLAELVEQRHPAGRVLLTGAFTRRAVYDAVNRGRVHGFATKPWTPQSLDALIQMALERSHRAAPRAERQRSTQ